MPKYTASFAIDVMGGTYVEVQAATPKEALAKLQKMFDKEYLNDEDNPFNGWEVDSTDGGSDPRIIYLSYFDPKTKRVEYIECDHHLEGVPCVQEETNRLLERLRELLQRERKLQRTKDGRPIMNKDGTYRYHPPRYSVDELYHLQTLVNYLNSRLGKPNLVVPHEDPHAPYKPKRKQ